MVTDEERRRFLADESESVPPNVAHAPEALKPKVEAIGGAEAGVLAGQPSTDALPADVERPEPVPADGDGAQSASSLADYSIPRKKTRVSDADFVPQQRVKDRIVKKVTVEVPLEMKEWIAAEARARGVSKNAVMSFGLLYYMMRIAETPGPDNIDEVRDTIMSRGGR